VNHSIARRSGGDLTQFDDSVPALPFSAQLSKLSKAL
jgi:hypothetical protein